MMLGRYKDVEVLECGQLMTLLFNLDIWRLQNVKQNIFSSKNSLLPHYSAQVSYFAAFRGIRDTKIEISCGIQDKTSLRC